MFEAEDFMERAQKAAQEYKSNWRVAAVGAAATSAAYGLEWRMTALFATVFTLYVVAETIVVGVRGVIWEAAAGLARQAAELHKVHQKEADEEDDFTARWREGE